MSDKIVPEIKATAERNLKWEVIRYYVFIGLKWFQVFVCLMTIIVGIIFEFILIFTGKKGWRSYTEKQTDKSGQPSDKCDCDLSILSFRYWWDVIFWLFVEVSIPGMIGASGEIIFLQVMYAVASTPIYPYSLMPWILTAGFVKGWSKPPQSLLK